MRWRVSVPGIPTAYTGKQSWVEAMLFIAKAEAKLNGASK